MRFANRGSMLFWFLLVLGLLVGFAYFILPGFIRPEGSGQAGACQSN